MSGKSVMIEEPKVAKLLFRTRASAGFACRFAYISATCGSILGTPWKPGHIISAPRTAKVT